jgi:hypothetical protein
VDDQETDGGNMYKQILINAKLKTGKKGQETTDCWEKSVREVKVDIGLQCYLGRIKRKCYIHSCE